ncbi:cation transporter [Lusitaniella coriacea LEGE 07157]|uniref:Cation transporter n=1 Tax=Lusitaniella coriacea LEGE 07157 TaxID=945747 RepID=A0A8J7E0U8_9CYAN|nr:cation transporter [Lusitaniella coriacea LEGE 07157]
MARDNRAEVRKVLVITLLLNVFVMVLKAFVGIITGSLSLQADALHSVTDGANNILGLIANRFASPHPDREHPYGHQKFEAVGALGIAAFLAVACFEILQSAIARLFHSTTPINISASELSILLLVLGTNIFVACYERRVGEQIGSPILIADAKHTTSDIWITITVLGGLVGVWLGQLFDFPQLQWLDIVLAFPVAILVFRSGWDVVRDNLPWLVDKIAIAPETIYNIVMDVPGVLNCHNIASRGVLGRQVFVEMHLIVDATDVQTAHKITEDVEHQLRKHFSPVRISIHIEPPNYQSNQIAVEGEHI